MAAETQTIVELEPLDHHGIALTIPKTMLKEPAESVISMQTALRLNYAQEPAEPRPLPTSRYIIITLQLAGISFITSFSNGLVIVALPTISDALDLPASLLLWPMNSYSLTTATCLLLAGAVADIVGTRKVNLAGCFTIALFILLSGFAKSGIELIMFRAMQGIGGAMAIPSGLSIISRSFPSGNPRNIGFACLGLGMPLGFSFGMVLSGVFIDGPGWRVGFYFGGAISFLLFAVGIWALPRDAKNTTQLTLYKRLATEIDWVGALLVSSSIGVFSYVLATLSANIDNIKHAPTISLLTLSLLLGVGFVLWMRRQERLDKPALIPNSLWKKTTFTTVCLLVLLSNAVANCMELLSSLFFQKVQGDSALVTSVKILPNMLIGIILNFTTGYFVTRLPVVHAILITCILCAAAPLLMALINPAWPYWYDAFFAQLLSPLSVDTLFTIGILIISDVFPAKTQALAGAVFNTLAQLGTSIGITITSVISVAVTKESHSQSTSQVQALMDGYRASFWAIFAWTVAACLLGAVGLRKVGKVGAKRE